MRKTFFLLLLFVIARLTGFSQELKVEVISFHPQLEKLISKGAPFEIVAEGMAWTEGPLWLEKEGMLLFSDIPTNSI